MSRPDHCLEQSQEVFGTSTTPTWQTTNAAKARDFKGATKTRELERGQNVPNLVSAVKIAAALGCSASTLVTRFESEMSVAKGAETNQSSRRAEVAGFDAGLTRT